MWSVGRPDTADDGRSVRIDLAGDPVTVSCDLGVDSVPEAWGTALALPAARAGAVVDVGGPTADAWRRGVAANVATTATWWGGAATDPIHRTGDDHPQPTRAAGAATGVAMCFTGGVDSFFSLLAGAHRPTHLLFVVGFDVPLGDDVRIGRVLETLADVAAATDTLPLVVRTDLRDHPAFASISWEHTHGAAIAAVAHLLHRSIGRVVIPPSYAAERLIPWGSRPDLDPNWSVPGRLVVEHGDASGRRLDRLRAIADEPLVQRHLRVCWHNVAGTLNCGRCEKCVRTMVMLAGLGVLERCETFPDRSTLVAALDDVDALPTGLAGVWRDLAALPLHPDEARAYEALIERSPV